MMCERALSRITQGELLARKQLVQAMIADSWIELEQFRLLVLRTAWQIDKYNDYQRVRGRHLGGQGGDAARCSTTSPPGPLQIHGSLGVSDEMPFASMVLESFHMGLADGATEVHKVTLARQVLKDYKATDDLFPTTHLPDGCAQAPRRSTPTPSPRRYDGPSTH